MFKFFNTLAYKITKENWGFPWHILLAMILTESLFAVYDKHFAYFTFPFAMVIVWIIINGVGLLYEMWEKYRYGNPRRDFWQDILANNLGFGLGVFVTII